MVAALVASGRQAVTLDARGLAEQIPGARVYLLSGDHVTAVADPAFPTAIVDFFAEVDGR